MSNFPTAIDAAPTLYSPVDAFSTKPHETTATGAIGAGDSTINVPSTDLLNAVEVCGKEMGAKKNKFKEAGITPVKGMRVKSPIVKECWLNIECKKMGTAKKTVSTVSMGEFDVGDHTWFLGQIVHTDVWNTYDRAKSLLYWDGEYRTANNLVKKV